ncbi:transglutaminase-like domain-containing protein, partial [Pseudomonas aeruginosa]|nr:transglutaminase-like domain-containing protein [Pseudomonas aeruginosa]
SGYCEHYSAAMTVMLRSLGIPARVVVGYSPGQLDPQTGSWLYLQSNAHAWVEAYFPGYGWIPFEPTANRQLGEFAVEPGEAADIPVPETEQAELTQELPEPTAPISTPDVNDDNTEATPLPTEVDQEQGPTALVTDDQDSGPPAWVTP